MAAGRAYPPCSLKGLGGNRPVKLLPPTAGGDNRRVLQKCGRGSGVPPPGSSRGRDRWCEVAPSVVVSRVRP